MSGTAQKRRLPPKIAKMQARKKQKLDPSETNTPKNKKKGNESEGVGVRIEALAWDEVAMPDQLDDYEGFFGLEEIEGVDIVRGDGGDKVTFMAAKGSTAKLEERGEGDVEGGAVGGREEDEEWGGIEDEAAPAADGAAKAIKAQSKKEKSKIAKQKSKNAERKKKQKATKEENTPGNEVTPEAAFALLEDAETDEDADVSAWKPLQLSSAVTAALSKLKFSHPTAIQSSAIPEILAGHDLIGKAPTGSGKTLAFGLPIYEHWLAQRQEEKVPSKKGEKAPIALIVLPTRELAHQISTHLSALCSKAGVDSPSIATLTGGLSIQKQRRILAQADIVIATPGRLWEVISEGQGVLGALKRIKFLVLDEADRLLSEGHFKELEEVLTALNRESTTTDAEGTTEDAEGNDTPFLPLNNDLPKQKAKMTRNTRQTLVFSATLSSDLHRKLSKRAYNSRSDTSSAQASMEYLLRKLSFREPKPMFIDINPGGTTQMAAKLREGVVECPGTEKDLYLYAVMMLNQGKRALVFVNSITAVRRLVPFLVNLGLNALPLHSQMIQKARLRSVERFTAPSPSTGPKANATPLLVATDVAARGLDIPNIDVIIHYHLPRAADTYVHRSGRTARAEADGSSIILCAAEEAAGVRRLVAQVHGKMDALAEGSKKKRTLGALKSLDMDPRVIAALRPRAVLSKKIADAEGAKERGRKEDDWIKTAAEDLGVDEDEVANLLDNDDIGKRGRGKGRKDREVAARGLSKAEVGALKAELKGLLARRVNVGVSERYLTANAGLDVHELLRASAAGGVFLGSVGRLGLDD